MKRSQQKLACVIAVLLLTAGCTGERTAVPLAPLGMPSVAAPANAQASQAAGGPSQPPANAAVQSVQSNQGTVSLQVVAPQDGAVVNAAQLQVSGTASQGSVVSVNDQIVSVGADGGFQTTVSLDEGPNLIEVIASNTSGSVSSVDLTVTYEP